MTDPMAGTLPRSYWAASSRRDAWRVELLTARDVYKRDLRNVTGGSLDWNVFRETVDGGTLELADDPRDDPDVDWLTDRFRITYVVEVGGLRTTIPMGVFLPARVQPVRRKEGRRWTVTLLGKTDVLARDKTPRAYAVPAGAQVTAAVANLVESAGERRHTVEPSGETLSTAMAWPAGTPLLRVVNDLLAAINYSPLYADGDGVLRASAYTPPDARPAVWDFGGADTVTSPDVEDDYDVHSIPNRYVLVGQESEDTEALVAVASNQSDGPYSYEGRGRWITETETGVDATSQAVLNDMAARKLMDSSRPVVRQTVEHLPLPLRVNEAAVGPDGHHMAVVEQRVTLTPGHLMSTTLRRFGAW